MDDAIMPRHRAAPEPVEIRCADGARLGGHVWRASRQGDTAGCVIINAATGVLARYYHRYARFLAENGFNVLTYDYRGIGLSRPTKLAGCGYRWREWGTLDFEAALCFMRERYCRGALLVVGHSIGGFLPGLAETAPGIDRILTVGAQYAWWWDYAPAQRFQLLCKWHVAMPVLTALYGYFPGRRCGWLEDLPACVAYEWAFRGPRFERSHPAAARAGVLARMAAVKAPILAVTTTDDEFGTLPAIRRALRYYHGAARTLVRLRPADYGCETIGHFGLFHDRHETGFWADTLLWLRGQGNPWPERVVPSDC